MRIRTHANPLSCTQHFEKIDTKKVFPEFSGKLDFEIGFGQSSFIRNHAQAHPNTLVVGIDVRKKTVELMQEKVAQENIQNIILAFGNGSICLNEMFDDHSIDNIFIFHPDPWLKRRHIKRRLVNPDFLLIAQQKLKPGGRIYVSTDVEPLWLEMSQTFQENTNFTKIDATEFWSNYYKTRWHEISQEKKRQTYFGTFELR